MKNYRNVNIDYDCRFELLESGEKVLPQEKKVEVVQTPFDSLIKTIYAPDERTGLPTGDLTYYVSDSVNPEIKEFILKNLLVDTSGAANPTVPEGIDMDTAVLLSRKRDETAEQYRERLNQFATNEVDRAKFLYEQAKSSVSKREATLASE